MKEYKRSELEEKQMGQKTAGRFDSGKLRYDLIPGYPLEELAKIYTYGAQKYDPDNYLKGMPWRKVIGPLFRHLWKWVQGEIIDEESGHHHLAHVAWNVFTLMIYEKENLGTDDRNPFLMDRLPHQEREERIQEWRQQIFSK